MPKTISYYSERYFSYVLAGIISFISFKFLRLYEFAASEIVFDKTVDFSGIIFGFLITVLTILIQTDNSAITKLKKGGRFKDLIGFNKRVIFISALLCFYSVLILIFKEYDFYKCSNSAKQYCMTIYIFLFVILIHTTYGFLKIFYEIIRSE